jgi:hypothetical protein
MKTIRDRIIKGLLVGCFVFISILQAVGHNTIVVNAADGDVQWGKNYGGSENESIQSIIPTSDGGYIAVGETYSVSTNLMTSHNALAEWGNEGFYDGIIVKMNADGSVAWAKNYGGARNEIFSSVIETQTGYLVVGTSTGASTNLGSNNWSNEGNNDGVIMEIDFNGDVQWAKNYGGAGTEIFSSVIKTQNGYLVVGYSDGVSTNLGIHNWSNEGSADGIIMEIDSTGAVLWTSNYGGADGDYFSSVTATQNGYLVVGGSEGASTNLGIHNWSNESYADGIIMEIGSTGTVLWAKNYGGVSNDEFSSVTKTQNGYLVVGYSQGVSTNLGSNNWSNEGSADGIIMEIDPTGDVQWAENYGGVNYDEFSSVIKTQTGYLVGGNSGGISTNIGSSNWSNEGDSDGIIMEIDSTGAVLWTSNYGGADGDYFFSVIETQTGYLVGGYSAGVSTNLMTSHNAPSEWGIVGNEDAILVLLDKPITIIPTPVPTPTVTPPTPATGVRGDVIVYMITTLLGMGIVMYKRKEDRYH